MQYLSGEESIHKGDEEACATLYIGKWIRYLLREKYSDEAIIVKYSNLQISL